MSLILKTDPFKQKTYELEGQSITKYWVTENGFSSPRHSKAMDSEDTLHFARSKEVTMLWRLKI